MSRCKSPSPVTSEIRINQAISAGLVCHSQAAASNLVGGGRVDVQRVADLCVTDR